MANPIDPSQMAMPAPNPAAAQTAAPTPAPQVASTPAPVDMSGAGAPSLNRPMPPGGRFHHLFDAFTGAVLGTMAGAPSPNYTADATGKMVATPPAQDTSGDKLKRIASAALLGLAAGSQVSPQKSSGAAIAAGLGAGAEAQVQRSKENDLSKRGQAKEDFDQQQKAILQKHEIARSNALTASTYFANTKLANDMTPDFAHNESLINAAKESPELTNFTHEMTDAQVKEMQQNDPNFISTHIIRPLGFAPLMDQSGKPVLDADEKPQNYMRFGVIDGTQQGQLTVTPEMAQNFKEYGSLAMIPNAGEIKPGQSYPLDKLLPLMNAVDEQRKNVLAGWQKSTVGFQKDSDGKLVPVETNAYDKNRTKPYSVIPAEAIAEMKKNGLTDAEIEDKLADAGQKRADAVNLAKFGISLPASYVPSANLASLKENDLKTQLMSQGVQVPPNFADLYALGHYKTDPTNWSSVLRKGVSGMNRDSAVSFTRNFVNPNYDQKVYPAIATMQKEFADTKPNTAGGNLIAFNAATAHLGQLYDAAQALQAGNIPALNQLAQSLSVATGGSAPVVFGNIKAALLGELGKTFKGSAGTDKDIELIIPGLQASLSPQAISDAIKTNAHLMLSKARALTSRYYGYTGEYPPEVIDPQAAAVYQKLGIDVGEILRGQGGGQPAANISGSQSGLTDIRRGPDGHTIGLLNGVWVDAQTKQPLQAKQAAPPPAPTTLSPGMAAGEAAIGKQ